MERESVLDQFFNNIEVVHVESEEEGWNMIKEIPSLWNKKIKQIHMPLLPSSSSRITSYPCNY